MSAPAASCPTCGGTAIQAQLVPMKNGAAGLLTVLATDDLAAGLLVAQNGKLVSGLLFGLWRDLASVSRICSSFCSWRLRR
jgi:hypothetical protein